MLNKTCMLVKTMMLIIRLKKMISSYMIVMIRSGIAYLGRGIPILLPKKSLMKKASLK